MTWLIASDLHGSHTAAQRLMTRMDAHKADRLLLLGDLLYHGPRNDLPEGYAPKETAALLNAMRACILCVRGNCDAEVDQQMLTFPILAEYAFLQLDGLCLYASHGHRPSDSEPPLMPGDLLLVGHTHVPRCDVQNGVARLNPGSVAIPKENSRYSYMTLQRGVLCWHDLITGQPYRQYRPGDAGWIEREEADHETAF